MWEPRTTPVKEGEKPFAWNVQSVYQCTWFCYFESAFHSLPFPCFWDRETQTGSYTDAKYWLDNYRDPWVPITDPDYIPIAGDILVYDGEYGHVIFCETDTMTAEYRSGDPNSFRVGRVGDYKGTLLGVLHCPVRPVPTVERNETIDQIETTDESLRIRTEPSLSAEIVGHVEIGYYNVLDKTEADGYTWYKIADDRWVADITTTFFPRQGSDFIDQIRKWADSMIAETKAKDERISKMEEGYKEISSIAEKFLK